MKNTHRLTLMALATNRLACSPCIVFIITINNVLDVKSGTQVGGDPTSPSIVANAVVAAVVSFKYGNCQTQNIFHWLHSALTTAWMWTGACLQLGRTHHAAFVFSGCCFCVFMCVGENGPPFWQTTARTHNKNAFLLPILLYVCYFLFVC